MRRIYLVRHALPDLPPEAGDARARRYQTALALKEKINALCGKEILL